MDDRLILLVSKAGYALKNYLKKEFASSGVWLSPHRRHTVFIKNKQWTPHEPVKPDYFN